jgi:CheY-like chemotaxis protein
VAGQGTVFRAWLPFHQGTEHLAEAETKSEMPMMQGLVLVVDDEATVREAVVDILETLELRVITAANGQEGLALFKQHQEELTAVLLDMQMPVMSGPETLRHIRQLDRQIPVVLSSGYSKTELSNQLQDGATTFLQKPYNMDRLIEVITAVVQ